MITRRNMLAGLGAVAALGFDTTARAWVGASSNRGCGSLKHLPWLDGEIIASTDVTAPYASDLGNIVHKTPVAVLYPGSVRDIEEMVRYCRKYDIKVAARGQGHTTNGQSMVNGGLVIDMRTLNQIHSIGPDGADVDAGVTWKTLVAQTVPLGFSPPVLTGYINLSIGGTLSVGGISISNRRGAQVDNIQELQVVTGKGDAVWCSKTKHRDLFDACLAGLGQCGIITRVVTNLIETTTSTRNYILQYGDNATYFEDLKTLLNRGEIEDIYTLWFPNGAGGWLYQINAIKYFNDFEAEPDQNYLLRDLNLAPSDAIVQDQSFMDNALKVDVIIDFLESIGQFRELQHPWFDVWLPDEEVESYVGETLAELTPEDVGPTGFILMLSQKREHLTRPNLRVPGDTEWVHLFDVLTASAVPGPDPAFESRMLQRNRRLFEKARAVGGTRYPIGCMPFNKADWAQQYGEVYSKLVHNKKRFDPDNILTPGPGIF